MLLKMLPIFEYIGSEKRGNRNTLFAKIAADNEVHSGVRALAKLVAIPNNYLLRFPELLLMAVEKIANAKMNTIELLAMSVILADRSILMEVSDKQHQDGAYLTCFYRIRSWTHKRMLAEMTVLPSHGSRTIESILA